MGAFNWGMIETGFEFQAMCGTLLGMEQPSIQQFSALGPDRGIDAYLEKDSAIYQFKFHREPSTSTVRSDAKSELEKVLKRRQQNKDDHYWSGAKKWVLVTNVEASPKLIEAWKTEIAPRFLEQQLVAEIVTREYLESLLVKHPAVAQAYFEKNNRCFISLNEAFEAAKSRRIQAKDLLNPVVGRQNEIEQLQSFLKEDSKRLLVISGAGGIGKTRFLFESAKAAANSDIPVYWAAVNTLESSSNWILGLPADKPILLIIDEPNNPQTARILLEQLQTKTSPFSQWKVLVAVRSQNYQMLEALRSKRDEGIRSTLELPKLKEKELSEIAFDLLQESSPKPGQQNHIRDLSDAVGKASDGFPIWCVVATQLLQQQGNFTELPKDHWDIAKAYIVAVGK